MFFRLGLNASKLGVEVNNVLDHSTFGIFEISNLKNFQKIEI